MAQSQDLQTPPPAEKKLDLSERVATLENQTLHLATKTDITELRGEMRGEIAELRQEMIERFNTVNESIAELKGQIKIMLWMWPTMTAMMMAFVTAMVKL